MVAISREEVASWSEFSRQFNDRFGHEQHELAIRQLFSIRQTTTVSEYVEQFSELTDQLVAYEHTTDPIYYTVRFNRGS